MESAALNILLTFILCCYGAIQVSASTCPANTYFIPLEDIQVAAEFTKIAYLHGDAVSTSNGFTIVETIHKSLDENNEIKIVVAENVDERIIAFRGVNGLNQLVSIVGKSLSQQRIDDWFPPHHNVYNAKVNKYFLAAFDLVLPALERYLEADKKIIFTGHSLGGALASLLSLHSALMTNSPWSNEGTCLITFGQPKIGNKQFTYMHNQIISSVRKMIFIFDKDPVPKLPPSIFFINYTQLSGGVVLDQAVNGQNEMTKNAYVCTEPSSCDKLAPGNGATEDHEVDLYMSFLTSQSKWYGRDDQLKSSMEKALSENC